MSAFFTHLTLSLFICNFFFTLPRSNLAHVLHDGFSGLPYFSVLNNRTVGTRHAICQQGVGKTNGVEGVMEERETCNPSFLSFTDFDSDVRCTIVCVIFFPIDRLFLSLFSLSYIYICIYKCNILTR